MLVNQIERQQRVAQVIEHAQEEHDIKFFVQKRDVVNRQTTKLDVEPVHLGCKAGLIQILVFAVDTEHARGTATLHLDRIETCIAANIEDGAVGKIRKSRRQIGAT